MEEIFRLKSLFRELDFAHVLRSANRVAHTLALST